MIEDWIQKNANPTPKTLEKVARALGVELSELTG